MFKPLVLSIVLVTLNWQYVEAIYARYTSLRMRHKLCALERELYRDSKAKVTAIWHMRKHYSAFTAYQLARIIYMIRRKYVRMIFVYMKTITNFLNAKYEHHIHVDHLREIHHLAFEIDNLIQSIEDWEDRKTRKKRITRTGGNNGPKPEESLDARTLRERLEKAKQRAYVERKKMLLSLKQGNSRDKLERSQFQRKDPVEEGFDSDGFRP